MSSQSQAAPAILPLASPDHYQLSGGGIAVTFTPVGTGGIAHLHYQDANRTLNFSGNQIRKVDVPDLGTVVSVTLALTVDSGSTTFSVLIPVTQLPNRPGSSTAIHTEGITTIHKFSLVSVMNIGQDELYTFTPMSGTASLVIIPL